jgi:hypothetical protein
MSFSGELPRPVIVRAIGDDDGKAVGVEVAVHHVIGPGLGRRVGAVWLIARRFGEARIRRQKRAVDLVGRDVHEDEVFARLALKRLPIAARAFEKIEGSDDVRLDELGRIVDRTIDVAFGREVHDRAGLVLVQELAHQSAVVDVSAHEDVLLIACERTEIVEVAGIGQLVEIDDGRLLMGEPFEDKVRADETRAAGHKDHENSLAPHPPGL